MNKVFTLLTLGLAQGLGNSSQGAVHLGSAPESRNVARHRPCKPRPVCSHLVDGRIDLNALDPTQAWTALARSSAHPKPVFIFLRAPTFVSQISVHLIRQGNPGAGRVLMVSLWNTLGREHMGAPAHRWKWDPQHAIAGSDGYPVVVPVQKMAVAVSVAWEGPPVEAANGNESDIWISEVLVLQATKSSVSQNRSVAAPQPVVARLGAVDHAGEYPLGQVDQPVDTHQPVDAHQPVDTHQPADTQQPVDDHQPDPPVDPPAAVSTLRALGVKTLSTAGVAEPPRGHKLRASGFAGVALPQTEFTTSVQMHVPQEVASQTAEPTIVESKGFQKVEEKVVDNDVAGKAYYMVHQQQKTTASSPNASAPPVAGAGMDPNFLSPWPERRSQLGIAGLPLKTCFAAVFLVAALVFSKFNKSCCKEINTQDLEYNYDRLPLESSQVAVASHEDSWEAPRQSCQEPQAVLNSAQQRSLSPNALSVSDRTISEPEQEPHDEAQSEPSISGPSTLTSTTVSEAEDEDVASAAGGALRLRETRHDCSEHMMMLYASPLCFRDGRGMMPLPQIPVEKEWETVLGAYNEASHILSRTSASSPGVSINAQTLTSASLQRAITTWHPGVLHLSSHGVKDCLVLEDGGGTAHFFSCSMLRGMLELAGSSTRLVLLNCCSLSSMGHEFVTAGVPHVVCCSCDIRDSAAQVFLRNFYRNLFQGTSVRRAFNEAIVALKSHSERHLAQQAHHFRLLPEGAPGHDEVLFQPKAMEDYDSDSSEGRQRRRRKPRRPKTNVPQVQASLCWRTLPSLPEDFLGREVDVWSVLQQLNQRRAVVVCSAPGEDFGIGKTAVLDSVHRAFTLLGHSCVAVQLRSLSQASWAGDWIEKANAAIRVAIRECRGARVTGANSRRRRLQGPLRTGFHPLSDPSTAACLLDDLIDDMLTLQDLCDARFEWTTGGHRILLLLDECDHLVQQQQFQDALACILQRCSSYSVVLSTHQPMVPAGASKFKVVQHRLQGLVPRDAARLLLRRAQRPLRWGEIQRSDDPSSLVILNKENESEVLEAVSSQPQIAALRGNPRRLIELANDLDSLSSEC